MVTNQHDGQREDEEPVVAVAVTAGETEDEMADESRLQTHRQVASEVGTTASSMIGAFHLEELREGDSEERDVNGQRWKSGSRGNRQKEAMRCLRLVEPMIVIVRQERLL